MPEGDTIFRAARTLHRALAGRVVTRFESVLPGLNRIDADHPIAGRTILSVASRGKHLLMTLSGDLVLHTHMRMNGSWHVYRPGERWQRPARDMRVVVATAEMVAVGFNIPVAEFLSARDVDRHPQLRALGPDLTDPQPDHGEMLRRIRAAGAESIGDVLLNQGVLSGIGNVLKSEVLFVSGVNPFTRVNDLMDDAVERVLETAHRLMAMNIGQSRRTVTTLGRRTRDSLNPGQKLWVYGRGAMPCRKCGALIEAKKTGLDARLTYWCPRCQPVARSS